MNKPIRVLITSIILLSLSVNSISAFASWGVDENGKYSFDKILVVVNGSYLQNPESIIEDMQLNYPVESIKIISENTDSSTEVPLVLLLNLSELDESSFKTTVEALSNEQYTENVLKDYYMTPIETYLGDVNQDGKITTEDARMVLKYAANQIQIKTETEKFLADADRDGIITTQDATYVLKVCSGINSYNHNHQ